MWRTTSIHRILVLVAAVTLAVACSATTGTGPSNPSSATGSTPTISAPSPWHLVFISSSVGDGVANLYAERAEKALGVTVLVTDWAIGGLSVPDAVAQVKQNPGVIAEAQIIVVFAAPDGTSANPMLNSATSPCVYGSGTPATMTLADWTPYRVAMDALYQQIWQLRGNQPTVLRAIDIYNPVVAEELANGTATACRAVQDLMTTTLHEAAAANGALIAPVYDAFNGTDHAQDPRLKGYIGDDGIHTTPAGAAVMADTLAALGFAAGTNPVRTSAEPASPSAG